jgi:hypothetical protein
MSILGKIFSSGANDLVESVGGVIDDLHTSKEEKLEAEQKIKEIILSHEAKLQEEVTNRWEADMASDSWLSKNVRPLTLMVFVDAGVISFEVDSDWKELLKMVLITTVGAYFGGRSYEKIKK